MRFGTWGNLPMGGGVWVFWIGLGGDFDFTAAISYLHCSQNFWRHDPAWVTQKQLSLESL